VQAEAQADGRWHLDKRQSKNQTDKRNKKVAMRGNGAMRGRDAGGWEAAV
jgi:hypothetical protein